MIRFILILLFVCSRLSNSQDSFFISKKLYDRQYKCVTNSSSALSWIDEEMGFEQVSASIYIPNRQATLFDCDIIDDDKTKNYFIKNPWLLEKNINTTVVDRRWEDMETSMTDFPKYNRESLTYTKLLINLAYDFEISLSIRTEKEAHIFLCDGHFPPNANCYWFMLQAFSGKGSAIRKCGKGQIPTENNIYPSEPCKTERSRINHPKFPNYLSNKYWSHFKLKKKNNYLSLVKTDGRYEHLILELVDHKNVIHVTTMFVHSKMVKALWKIHELDYIYTNKHSSTTNLGWNISPVNGVVCISMFVSMCDTCRLRLILNGQTGIIKEQIYGKQHLEWSEIKFLVENVQNFNLNLFVSTIGTSYDRFWAIDKVRQCQKTEYRIISSNKNVKCQLMSNYSKIISLKDFVDFPENNCPENTIGKFCVPCNWMYDDCKRIKVCFESYTTQCSCSAGFKGGNCDYECSKGYYGHNCQKRCGKCYYACDNIDGTCSYCTENYTGAKCDIPPAIVFANPPNVINTNHTSATVQMIDFRLANQVAYDSSLIYFFQIKKAEDSEDKWTSVGSAFHIRENILLPITKLEADEKYFVRSVIRTETKTYFSPNIPFTEFKTTCEDIAERYILVNPTNTTANISFQEFSKFKCKIKGYKITISSVGELTQIETNHVFFDYLTPFKNYTVTFHKNGGSINKTFRTSEGVPESVQNFKANALSSTSIELQWQEPDILNGILQHYTVEYQHESYLACNFSSPHSPLKNRLNVPRASTVLENLIPFSRYSFSVFAVNTKFDGISYTQQQSTLSSNDIQTEEIPQELNVEVEKRKAIIKLSSIDCTKMEGRLLLHTTLTCMEEWCRDEVRKESNDLPKMEMSLNNLSPFSNYALELQFCRAKEICYNEIKNRHFTTKPEVPNSVSDVLVYSKSNTTISLRWRPPYPPTGIVKEYIVRYRQNDAKAWTDKYVGKSSTCKLWLEFCCVKLTNLSSNHMYRMQIYVKNEDPEDIGQPSQLIYTKTTTEPSQPPYDLQFTWTLNNDLVLQWNHPNQSNGEIRYFKIEIISPKDDKIEKKLAVAEETYNLTYHYDVDAKDLKPSTQYTIKVAAYNGFNGYETTVTDTSPPEIPTLSGDPQISSTNNTITVNISVKQPENTEINKFTVLFLITTEEINLHPELLINLDRNNFTVVAECRLPSFSDSYSVTIGNNSKNENCRDSTRNETLDSGTSYRLNIILKNIFNNKTSFSFYSYNVATMKSETDVSNLFPLLLLLLVVPIAAILFMKRHQLVETKNRFMEYISSNETVQIHENSVPLSNIQTGKVSNELISEPKNIYSKSVKINKFEEYVKESIQNGELERQHALFPRGQTEPWTYGSIKENKMKNRYNNLIAYDHSRVILRKIKNSPYSDYINANYIDGYKIPKAYIATQGPKSSTLFDFWRMIWQENVKHIAMLANIYESGKKKVEKYWPTINETLEFGNISVKHLSSKVYADFEHRIFNVTRNEETRRVEQWHFLSWPDHGVPLYAQSLVSFLEKLSNISLSSKSPVVVHCSAGVGRTGTILLCDISLRMAAKEGSVDVLRNIQKLRGQRANLVDNVEQYKLAHLVILESLLGMKTAISCNELEESLETLLTNDDVALQMQYLKESQWQDLAMLKKQQKEVAVVNEKNRFPDIIPETQGRVFITRSPFDDEKSSYINAITVEAFRSPERFIVTQQPMPNTLGDFWRLIDEKDIGIIVSLNEINFKDKTSCHFWPSRARSEMNPVAQITLKHSNTLSLDCYNLITVHMYTASRKDYKVVEIFSIKSWPPRTDCPKNVEQFLSFWEDSDAASRKSKQVVVTCYDGVKASGLYVAMSFIIEKIKMEHTCDVCQAVRTVRRNRHQFIQEKEQFVFLYQAALRYVNGFQSYANFN